MSIMIFVESIESAVVISVFVFIMMLFVDYINVITKGRMSVVIKGGRLRQYFTASFLGAIPGCLGSFMNVSFYTRGLISFGAIVGGMIATCGDEAFIMLAVVPKQAFLLFAILFVVGIVSAFIVDKLIPRLKIKLCEDCNLVYAHNTDECRCLNLKEIFEYFKKISFSRSLLLSILLFSLFGMLFGVIGHGEWGWESVTMCSLLLLALFIIITVPEHYLEEHIWRHIAKKHLWRIFLWSLGALTAVNIFSAVLDLEVFIKAHMVWVLLIASLVGIIPESGPNIIFVMMFSKGMIPFSVLVANSIVQDGHGMLPMLSYSVKDSIYIKSFNLFIGLTLGYLLFLFGI